MKNDRLKQTILKFDRQVPRYTSYPTAPHFKDGFKAQDYQAWLKEIPQDARLSVYLHIPYCTELCWYCGCHTKITKRYEPVEKYCAFLLKEISLLGKALGVGRPVSHVHFGGGSPTIVSAEDFKTIMDALRDVFAIEEDAEIAIEVDPRTVDRERIETYAAVGINRLSIGAQDFNDKTLEAVNRVQPFELTRDVIEMARENGISKINMDLLYGLPFQSEETMRRTIDKALSLNPDRFALFGYAHVPWMKKHMRLIDEDSLPDKSLRYDLALTAHDILVSHGYQAIGIDHYARLDDKLAVAARSGQVHRNFQGYTDDRAETLLPLGVSSIGTLPHGFVQNASDLPHYTQALEQGELPVQKFCPVDAEDRLRAEVIETLMGSLAVDPGPICLRHGFAEDHLDSCLESLDALREEGLVTVEGRRQIEVNPDARVLTRLAAAAFDRYFDMASIQPARHARAI